MTKLTVLKPSTKQKLQNLLSTAPAQHRGDNRDTLRRETFVFRNNTNQEIPPYGIIGLAGTELVADRYGFIAEQPDGRHDSIAFNLNRPVPSQEWGSCTLGPLARASYPQGAVIGAGYVGVTGFQLDDGSGFHAMLSYGVVDSAQRIALVTPLPDLSAVFITPNDGIPAATGVDQPAGPVMCQRLWFSKTLGFFVTPVQNPVFDLVYNNCLGAINGDVRIQAKRLHGYQWFADVVDCNQ